jgi:2-keto-4-pentenoate hydratase/2-oxohepta-3-ene-1,7-dioic acid hydratase in catechol pathway
MKWATYRRLDAPDGVDRVGLVVAGEILGLAPGASLLQMIGSSAQALAGAASEVRRSPSEVVSLEAMRLRPPIPKPPAIRDYSSFYEHHKAGIEAIGQKWDDAWYEVPFFYFSNPNNLLGDGDVIRIPHNSRQMDYELEMCAVIGTGGIDIDPAEADRHIAGFCIFNDWSARDLQRDEMARAPVGPAKGKDTANSMGPFLVTPDEIEARRSKNGYDLLMKAFVNGKLYSSGNWSTVYWSMAEQIAYASRNTPLVPGDVLCTGTVGTGCILEISRRPQGATDFPWLKAGDEVTLEVEGIGRLSNRIEVGQPPKPIRGRVNGSRV